MSNHDTLHVPRCRTLLQRCTRDPRYRQLSNSMKPGEQRRHVADERVVEVVEALAGDQPDTPAMMMMLLFKSGRYSMPMLRSVPMNRCDVALKDELLQHLRLVEPEEVDVVDQPQLRREVEVDADVDKMQARVDEVGLALDLAGPQVGHQAEAVDQVRRRTARSAAAASS